MARAPALAIILGVGLLLAGCAQKGDPAATSNPGLKVGSTNATANNPNATKATPSPSPANATNNGTAPADDMPQEGATCMRGMDHPGCTAQQAENQYKKWKAAQDAKGPAPDRALTPLKISLNPQGTNQGASANIDEGTMTLFITVYLNDTGPGPYAAVGSTPMNDIQVVLKGTSTTKTITLQGTSASIGADPAAPLAMKATSIISMPESAVWNIQVNGQGQNARVEIDMLERFTMENP